MDRTLYYPLSILVFWFGACIASFLNVVIWRVPRGESIVSPPSHCPKCAAPIKWYQNLPIVSWLVLRGRCANCREPISPRYVLVELLGGLVFWAVFRFVFGSGGVFNPWLIPTLVMLWIWFALMIVGSFIDYDHQVLPDFVTIGGMVLALVYHLLLVSIRICDFGWSYQALRPLAYPLAGFAVGFGLLWLIRYWGGKAFRREAMGEGDVYLMGAIGALFGPTAVLVTLFLSALLGSVAGLGMIALAKTKFGRFAEIPYGPFICMGCAVWIFWGAAVVDWYLALLK